MNPSRAAIDLIQARVTDWTQTDDAIAATLNTPSVANPIPQAQVQRIFKESELSNFLVDTTQADPYVNLRALLNWVNFGLLKADIERQDQGALLQWSQKLVILGIITPAQQTAIEGYLTTTVPDPNYQDTISWAQANLGRDTDVEDIAASRPQG